MKNTVNSGFNMPKAWDITNTAVQLESKSWAVAQRELLKAWCAKQRLPLLRLLALSGLTAQAQHCEANPPFCPWLTRPYSPPPRDHSPQLQTTGLRFQRLALPFTSLTLDMKLFLLSFSFPTSYIKSQTRRSYRKPSFKCGLKSQSHLQP